MLFSDGFYSNFHTGRCFLLHGHVCAVPLHELRGIVQVSTSRTANYHDGNTSRHTLQLQRGFQFYLSAQELERVKFFEDDDTDLSSLEGDE